MKTGAVEEVLVPGNQLLGVAARIADDLLEVQTRVNGLIDTALAELLPDVRQRWGVEPGNDVDLYREWANAVVHGHVAAYPSRRFATGIVALRPDRDGHITGYSGVDEAQARLGEWVIDAHLPPPGTPTQPVEAGYWANAYVRMRHPDYDALRGILDDVGRTVHVYAG